MGSMFFLYMNWEMVFPTKIVSHEIVFEIVLETVLLSCSETTQGHDRKGQNIQNYIDMNWLAWVVSIYGSRKYRVGK